MAPRPAPAPAPAPARKESADYGSYGGSSIPPWEDLPPEAHGLPAESAPAAPATRSAAPVAPPAAAPVAPAPVASVPAPVAAAPVQPVAPAVPVDGIDWHALQHQLDLGGMNRELALNSELLAVEGDLFRLRLDRAFSHLLKLNRGGTEKLQEALSAQLGRPVRVQLDVGEIATETPARRNQALKAERLALARNALAQDPFVHELQNRFGATLDEGSVKAV